MTLIVSKKIKNLEPRILATERENLMKIPFYSWKRFFMRLKMMKEYCIRDLLSNDKKRFAQQKIFCYHSIFCQPRRAKNFNNLSREKPSVLKFFIWEIFGQAQLQVAKQQCYKIFGNIAKSWFCHHCFLYLFLHLF